MAAFRIFSRFAELLDIKVSRAAAAWLRLNTDGTVSERTAAQTLGDLGAMTLDSTQESTAGKIFPAIAIRQGDFVGAFSAEDVTLADDAVYKIPTVSGTICLTPNASGQPALSSMTGLGTGVATALALATNATGGVFTQGSAVSATTVTASGAGTFASGTFGNGSADSFLYGPNLRVVANSSGAIIMGSTATLVWSESTPTAAKDIRVRRSATKTLTIDDNVGGSATLAITGNLTASGTVTAPIIQAATGKLQINTNASGPSGAGSVRFGGSTINTLESWGGTASGALYIYSEGNLRALIGGSSGINLYQSVYPDNTGKTLGLSTHRWGTLFGTSVDITGTIKAGTYTVGTTPSHVTGAEILISSVSGATVGAAVTTGGGAMLVKAASDGSAWICTAIIIP